MLVLRGGKPAEHNARASHEQVLAAVKLVLERGRAKISRGNIRVSNPDFDEVSLKEIEYIANYAGAEVDPSVTPRKYL